MALIPQFETDPTLINISDRHHAWHTYPGGAHGFPSRKFPKGAPGSGHEFLQFHGDLMNEFFAWNNVHHAASPSQLAPWTAVPAELKGPETGWPNPFSNPFNVPLDVAEKRINSNNPPFPSDDDLGIYIETTVHDWIHGAVAASIPLNLPADEKEIISGFHSVQSTYFYKIHGLVQLWWTRWLHPKHRVKEVLDAGPVSYLKEARDGTKASIKEFIDIPVKNQIKDFSDSVTAGKPFGDVPDPFRESELDGVLQSLSERVARLEAQSGVKKSHFIRPFDRPNVGESVVRGEKGNEKQ